MFQGDSGFSKGTVPGRDGGKVEAAQDGPSPEKIRARSSEPEGLV